MNLDFTKAPDADKLDGLDSTAFAKLNGDNNQRFKIANAVNPDEALAKGQFNPLINSAMDQTFYIDADNGDDNNDGSSAHPFKTIKKAVDSVPISGIGNIVVLGDYTLQQDTDIRYKHINLTPKGTLTFPWTTNSSGKYAGIVGINFYNSLIKLNLNSNYNGKIVIEKNNTGATSLDHFRLSAFRIGEGNKYGYIKCALYTFQDNYNPIIVKDGSLVSIHEWSGNRPAFLGVSISGYYGGTNRSIQVDSDAYLVNFENTPSSFYYNYDGGLTDLSGNSINIDSVVAGIVKDSNSVPRNVISNIVF